MRRAARAKRRERARLELLESFSGRPEAPAEYFRSLEDFIERARGHLQQVPDPEFRAQLRQAYRSMIQDALRSKLEGRG